MSTNKIVYNSNMVNDIKSFTEINNKLFSCNSRSVCFVRISGINETFCYDITEMDIKLNQKMNNGQLVYKRINELSKKISFEISEYYSKSYENWLKNNKSSLKVKTSCNAIISQMLNNACKTVVFLFNKEKIINNSIEKNFVVKLLFWFDNLFEDISNKLNENIPIKIVSHNIFKKQEYLFFYMLTQMGINVMLLQNENDIDNVAENMKLSTKVVLGNYDKIKIPDYYNNSNEPTVFGNSDNIRNKNSDYPIKMSIPQRTKNINQNKVASYKQNTVTPIKNNVAQIKEKSFEELAQLAKSVVMISLHDKKGQIIGQGSGIMIGKDGYILTNNHVAKDGAFYSVHIENDQNAYYTDERIKYNYLCDLAIIRIDRKLEPIPVYKGEKELVRGQKVVAIGSPLGLFNSVSDGIISGFRTNSNDVKMMQFTAPISSGSSGGAVLNMYGEVIGISTAGIDEGQNINLAVDYTYINSFIRGFV